MIRIPKETKYLDALERWYGQDNEDWISLRRSEVQFILEDIQKISSRKFW